LAGKSLEALLALAHFTASQPGAVKLMPQMGWGTYALFVGGLLWLGLWRGRARLWGLAPVALATVLLLLTPAPDLLISGDGHNVAITGEGAEEGGRLLVLRDTKSDFTRENLQQLAGTRADLLPLAQWPGVRCSRDFCSLTLKRGGRGWNVLLARSEVMVPERSLAAACELADVVVSDRSLPLSCQPRWLKADRRMLGETGGLAIDLSRRKITKVAQSEGEHGWWPPRVH
jgi:competence protein ComEC